MKKRTNLSRMALPRGAQWAAPAAVLAVVGGVVSGPLISPAQAAPSLPPRTPAQLLAAVAGKAPAPPPLSGTVVETASLGLPALPSTVGTVSLPSLLAGSHTIKVWYSDPAHYRFALPQPMSESDVVASGSSLWLWGSSADQVTHVLLPAGNASSVPSLPLTPQQAADQVLAKTGPTTAVSVDRNVTVAGEAAYQLVLAPESPGSLISQVRIAIDGKRDVPLRVQVFAKGASRPAVQVGFTSISFGKPAASNFTFRPPTGATVMQQSIGSGGKAGGSASGSGVANGLTVIGHGWLAVAALPESSLPSLTGTPAPASSGGSALQPFGHSSQRAAPASGSGSSGSGSSGMTGLGIGAAPIVSALLHSARHVSGSWGSGRLLRTPLVSMLVTSNGRVLAGAVTPDVLFRAVSRAGHAVTAGSQHAAAAAAPK